MKQLEQFSKSFIKEKTVRKKDSHGWHRTQIENNSSWNFWKKKLYEKLYQIQETDPHLGIKKQRSIGKNKFSDFCIKERKKNKKIGQKSKNREKLTVETVTIKINSFCKRFFCFFKYKQYFLLIIFCCSIFLHNTICEKVIKTMINLVERNFVKM